MSFLVRLAPYVALLLSVSSPVWAKGKADKQQSREKVARKACITGDVKKGIDLLGDLYVETEDITYVFNQGRCYQQNHRWEDALDRFTEYVRKSPGISEHDQTEVDKYIADCKAHLPPEQTLTVPAGPAPLTTVPAAGLTTLPGPAGERAPVEVTPPPEAVGITRPDASSSSGTGLRNAGIIVGAAGLAAIAAGVVLDLKTHSIVNDVHSNGYDAGKLSSRDTYETWGWISFGAGGAALVTGTTLYLLGYSGESRSSTSMKISVVPISGQNGALILLRGGIQ
jgi:hypothetical protein